MHCVKLALADLCTAGDSLWKLEATVDMEVRFFQRFRGNLEFFQWLISNFPLAICLTIDLENGHFVF
jgi:hypothetical protein